jgi:DNA-binding NtrC family response regulator
MKDIEESIPVTATAGDARRPAEAPAPSDHVTLPDEGEVFTLRTLRTRAEIEAIQRALGRTGWNRSQAARLLKISYRSLLLKIQRHKITHQTQ